MKVFFASFIVLILFSSYDSGCGKNYHEEIKFVNSSSVDVILAQYSFGIKSPKDTAYEFICGFRQLDIIQAGGTVNYFEGGASSIEDKLRRGVVFPYYIIDPYHFSQGEIPCDSFDFKAKYLKKFEPNLADLKASNFTYYYP